MLQLESNVLPYVITFILLVKCNDLPTIIYNSENVKEMFSPTWENTRVKKIMCRTYEYIKIILLHFLEWRRDICWIRSQPKFTQGIPYCKRFISELVCIRQHNLNHKINCYKWNRQLPFSYQFLHLQFQSYAFHVQLSIDV